MKTISESDEVANSFLMFVLLFFSGNPLATVFGKYAAAVALIMTVTLTVGRIDKFGSFFSFYLKIFLLLLLLFISQNIVLGYVSWLGAFNFFVKIFVGGLILYQLRERFPYFFFHVLSILSIISIFGFIVVNLLKVPLPGIEIGEAQTSYIAFGVTPWHQFKNEGMFWEPGAFAGILTLCLALNFNQLEAYWKLHRAKLLSIIIALLTTQSTTGYIVGFVILLFYLLNGRVRRYAWILLPMILVAGVVLFNNVEFLKNKVSKQYLGSLALRAGQFSNTRFGSLILDLHYIAKHPLIGNGMHEETRYADQPHLLQLIRHGVNLGAGNGFSGSLASFGVPYVFMFFLAMYLALKRGGNYYAFVVITVLVLNLQGEQWQNVPLFLGLPFLSVKNKASFAEGTQASSESDNELNISPA